MTRISIAALVAASLFLGACAQSPDKITPAYVSHTPFLSMDCRALSAEAASLNRRVADLTGKQDKAANNDAALTAVAVILFWPAAFFVAGGEDHAAELAQLRGQAEAITQAAQQKGCNS